MHSAEAFVSLCLTIAATFAAVVPDALVKNPTVPLRAHPSRQVVSTIPPENGGFCEPTAQLTERLKLYVTSMKEKTNDGQKAISDKDAEDLAHYYEALAMSRKGITRMQKKQKLGMKKRSRKEKDKLSAKEANVLENLEMQKKQAEEKVKKLEEKIAEELVKTGKRPERLNKAPETAMMKGEQQIGTAPTVREDDSDDNSSDDHSSDDDSDSSDDSDDDEVLCYTPDHLELYHKVLVQYQDPTLTFPGVGEFAGSHEFIRPKQYFAAPEGSVARISLLPGALRSTYPPCTHYYSCIYVDCYCCLHGWLGSGRRGFEYCADSIDVPSLNSNTVRDRECKVAFIKWWVISEPGGLEVERPCFYASRCDAWLWENTMDDLKDPRKCLCDSSPYKGMPGFSGACVKQSTDLVMSFEPQS